MAEGSVIGQGTVVRGNVRGDGSIEIYGRVDGDVLVSGDVTLGENAAVRGQHPAGSTLRHADPRPRRPEQLEALGHLLEGRGAAGEWKGSSAAIDVTHGEMEVAKFFARKGPRGWYSQD